MSENTFDGEVREKNEKFQRVPDMLELNRFFEGETCTKVNYREVAASLPKSVREKITSRKNLRGPKYDADGGNVSGLRYEYFGNRQKTVYAPQHTDVQT